MHKYSYQSKKNNAQNYCSSCCYNYSGGPTWFLISFFLCPFWLVLVFAWQDVPNLLSLLQLFNNETASYNFMLIKFFPPSWYHN